MAADPPDAGMVEEKEGEGMASPPLSDSRNNEEIKAVARKYADDPIQDPDPGVWAVLTAISQRARQRAQGLNIILNRKEHSIGRLVEDNSFRINNFAISGNHCRIYWGKKTVSDDAVESPVPVFLKDISTNGTYLNWEKLTKSSPGTRVQHGDIISFLSTPDSEKAYAFVFRDVSHSVCSNGSVLKRKSEDQFVPERKRVKGIGIGAPDGPISLDDVRSLQRSNMELRKQLESNVNIIENMRTEALLSITRQENELKELKKSMSNSYLDQIKELQHMLEVKQKELDDVNIVSAERQLSIKNLNERLSAAKQSRAEADVIINSQKAIITEREAQLDEERNQRRVEREMATADLKSALQRAHSEAQEEIKRQADIHLQQQREQQEYIVKLQELEKENRVLVETLQSKLEDTREGLVMSEKKGRQLEAQLQEERIHSESNKKRSEMLELEIKKLKKDLESEKVAQEEAWAKVSARELELAAARRELSIEQQRYQGAKEKIILRETQLRACYSTAEEITALCAKQQEQLKAMQESLKDDESYDNTSMGFDLNVGAKDEAQAWVRGGEASAEPSVNIIKKHAEEKPSAKMVMVMDSSSSNDNASTTEKHDCDTRNLGDREDTQDLECTSADRSVKGFGSDIDGIGRTVVPEGERDAVDTEGVPETESQGVVGGVDGKSAALRKCSNLEGDTMLLEDDVQIQENIVHTGTLDHWQDHCSQSRLEDTEAGAVRTANLLASEGLGSWANSTAPSVHGENDSPGTGADTGALHKCCNLEGDTMQLEDDTQMQENIVQTGTLDHRKECCSRSRLDDTGAGAVRTTDLLASEGLGSSANSTAPSVHGENDSPGSGANAGAGDIGAATVALCSSDALAAGSQSNAAVSVVTKLTEQHQALSAMMEIVAPNFKEQFPGVGCGLANDSLSDAETEEGSDRGDDEDDSEESNRGDDTMIEDSIG